MHFSGTSRDIGRMRNRFCGSQLAVGSRADSGPGAPASGRLSWGRPRPRFLPQWCGRDGRTDSRPEAGATLAVILLAGFVVAGLLVAAGSLSATDLQPQTLAAYSRYLGSAEARIRRQQSSPGTFLTIDTLPGAERAEAEDRLNHGEIWIQKAEGTPLSIPGGLIHHWMGTAFIPGATLPRTLALIQDYDHLPRYYSPDVDRSRLLSRHDDDFRISMRLRKHKVATVVLDTNYDVHYGQLDSTHHFSISHSTRVVEIASPGGAGEHALPEGNDDGFLWRLDTYWRFVQSSNGVFVECEAISLTRDVPAGLGWLIGPFIEEIPRESLEFTLRATRAAILSPAPTTTSNTRRNDVR